MGQAKQRGTFDERRAAAIKAGRVPKGSAVVDEPIDLRAVLAYLLSVGIKKKRKTQPQTPDTPVEV